MDSKLTVKVFSVKIISRCCLHQKRDLNCEMTHDIILEMLLLPVIEYHCVQLINTLCILLYNDN